MGRLIIDLQDFEVCEKQEITKDESYLWVFGILIDLNTFSNKNYIVRKRPTHGNLGGSFGKGESRSIPEDLGKITKSVEGIAGMIAAGVLVVAWEHDVTKKSKQKAAYDETCKILSDFIDEKTTAAIGDILASGEDADVEPTKSEMRKLSRDIEAKIKEEFINGNKVNAIVTSIFGGFDDYIETCQKFETFNTSENKEVGIEFKFKPEGKSIDYRINGTINYKTLDD